MPCADCDRLILEAEAERRKAKEAAGKLAIALASPLRHEPDMAAGVRTAIRWIQTMPRRELVHGGMRIGVVVYQRVASSIARYLEERLDSCEEPTRPTLPPTSEG